MLILLNIVQETDITFIEKNLISLIAIAISFISLVFVVVDKIKNWSERNRIKILKKDKTVLSPLLTLKVESFTKWTQKQKGNISGNYVKTNCSSLYAILKSIDSKKINNTEIAILLSEIQNEKAENLIIDYFAPDTNSFTKIFNNKLTSLINNAKYYLSGIL